MSTVRGLLPWLVLVVGCARLPVFTGQTDQGWVTFRVPTAREPSDILPAFRASARWAGCGTDPLFERRGRSKLTYGHVAHCDEGILAVVLFEDALVVGCHSPMTLPQCQALFARICEARDEMMAPASWAR
ncbi:MAG: hypothetical protein JNL79_03635 [Myxococcales bacterium]|nr:hypothetical protein [Myxococcales bacterium]